MEGRAEARADGRAAAKGRGAPVVAASVQLRVRPTVQGAVLVLENKTGRILAMAGGFSYPLSQLNRVSQTQRQPRLGNQTADLSDGVAIGIAAKHFGARRADYVAANRQQRQRQPEHCRPRHRYGARARLSGHRAMRAIIPAVCSRCGGGLENSINIVTARLAWMAASMPSLEKRRQRLCHRRSQRKSTEDCVRYYPFVLGASRCGWSILPLSMGRSPMKASGRSRIRQVDEANGRTDLSVSPTRSCLLSARRTARRFIS